MNKLEEYRDNEAKNGDRDSYGELDEFKAGFNAAIGLNLPVKFAEWKDKEYQTITINKETTFSYIPRAYSKQMGVYSNIEKLYQHWLDDVFKPE